MCLQCLTKAVTYGNLEKGKHDVMPGYALMRATKSDYDVDPTWKEGQYGLVQMNDPDVIWTCTPVKDPGFGLSDEEIDALPESSFKTFEDNCEEMDIAFSLSPLDGYTMVSAAMKAGYDPNKNGRFIVWLQHHLAVWMEQNQPLTPEEELALLELKAKESIP